MKIGFYAYDNGPGTMLELVAGAARARGHTVIHSPKLAPIPNALISDYRSADMVVLGGPDTKHFIEHQISLIGAVSGVPIIILEDQPGSSMRERFKECASQVAEVITAMPQWNDQVRSFGYKRVRHSILPAHWEQSYREMTTPKGDLRKEFRKIGSEGQSTPLDGEDRVFYFGGAKESLITNRVLSMVRDTGRALFGERFVLAFKVHPGEEVCELLLRKRADILKNATLLDVDGYTSPELATFSDLAYFTGGSTDTIVSAFARRKNVIYYTDEMVRNDNLKMGIVGKWWVTRLHGVHEIDGPEEFTARTLYALNASGKAYLAANQEKSFPLPETWDTAPLVIEYLERVFLNA